MVKILVINTVGFTLNGISSVIKNYYEAMDKNNLQFEFISACKPVSYYEAFFKENDINCYVFNRKNVLSYMKKLRLLVKQKKIDIVHVHGNSSTMAIDLLPCKMANVPIRIAHSHNSKTTHPIINKLLHPLFDKSYTDAFACGEKAGKWLFNKRKFIDINNGINLDKYKFNENYRISIRKQLNVDSQLLIGHIGNFVSAKNHEFILDICKQLKQRNFNFQMLLIGDGPLSTSIKNEARDLKLDDKIIFLGRTDRVEEYLQAMDAFILPSIYEGLPLVLIEASAAGLPIYASDAIDRSVNVTDKIKFLPLNSLSSWINSILKIDKKNISERENTSENNVKLLSNSGYDINNEAQKIKKFFLSRLENIKVN